VDELNVTRSKLRAVIENPNAAIDVAAQRRTEAGNQLPLLPPSLFSQQLVLPSPVETPEDAKAAKKRDRQPEDDQLPLPAILAKRQALEQQPLPPPAFGHLLAPLPPSAMSPVPVDFEQYSRTTASPLQSPLTQMLGRDQHELQTFRLAAQSYRLVFPSVPIPQ
jgi:hypothetical protein